MLYTQSIQGCLESEIGYRGLPEATYRLWLSRCWSEIQKLQKSYHDKSLRLLHVPSERGDIAESKEAIAKLTEGAETIVFFGTGGSSLGGQMLAHFSRWYVPGENSDNAPGSPRIRFYSNLDADTLTSTFEGLDLKKSRFVITSKSGTTTETMLQAMAALQAVIEAGLEDQIPKLFLALTEPHVNGGYNGLRHLCEHYHIPVLDHDTEVGGRYSALTNVGLLPAIVRGLDVEKLRNGAQSVVDGLMNATGPDDFDPACAAAVVVGLTLERDIHNVVMMPYADRLGYLPNWFVQLWAESLGKDGKGATPVAAQGPVDQHSQLQLYLDGRPHMLTLIRRDCSGEGPRISPKLARITDIHCLSGRTAGDLVHAEQRAIYDALVDAGRPVRTIDIERMNEETLGGLMMHFMIETILSAGLLGINPFDQPAVEKGKILTRKYLRLGLD